MLFHKQFLNISLVLFRQVFTALVYFLVIIHLDHCLFFREWYYLSLSNSKSVKRIRSFTCLKSFSDSSQLHGHLLGLNDPVYFGSCLILQPHVLLRFISITLWSTTLRFLNSSQLLVYVLSSLADLSLYIYWINKYSNGTLGPNLGTSPSLFPCSQG